MKLAFSKYVSKDVVEEILRNENAIELRGQKLFMSVYFSDIRGFTEFSEKMDPLELSELLNKYFTPMSAIITKHQGTIDKYIGDAVMAMFGAPINYPDHATQACRAALQCVQALENINRDFQARGWPRIDIGIGINSGYMNAGNIGSETIQNYTVIGDSVNLASRLESLNKEYHTHIIISEYTYEIVKAHFECRELDTVNVKGKKEPVRIYELLNDKSAAITTGPTANPTAEEIQ
jgi:adenylate cyclase